MAEISRLAQEEAERLEQERGHAVAEAGFFSSERSKNGRKGASLKNHNKYFSPWSNVSFLDDTRKVVNSGPVLCQKPCWLDPPPHAKRLSCPLLKQGNPILAA